MSQQELEEIRLAGMSGQSQRGSDRAAEAQLGRVLEALMSSASAALHPKFSIPTQVQVHWDRAMGPILARRVQPVRFVGTMLYVRAADIETARQLQGLEKVLVEQICALSGVKVTGLTVLRERKGSSKHVPMLLAEGDTRRDGTDTTKSWPEFSDLPLIPLGTPWRGPS